MTFSVIGTDTSVYEGLMNIDKAVAAGDKFIMPKCGESAYIDSQFVNTWTHAKGKLKRSAFWFLSINYSIRGQAQKFADALKSDPGEIEPYVDFEQARVFWAKANPVNGQRGWCHLDFTHLSGFIFYFKEAIKAYYPVWPWKFDIGVYSGFSYWRQYGTVDPAFAVHPLWISEPDPVPQPLPLRPWGLGQWRFWQTQFAADGPLHGTDPLVAKGVDLNCFNGTPEQFEVDYGIGATPPVIPPVTPPGAIQNIVIEISSSDLNSKLSAVTVDKVDYTAKSTLSIKPVVVPPPVTPPSTAPKYWCALHDTEPRMDPETFKSYNELKFTVTAQLEAYWRGIIRLLNPLMNAADFEQNWHNLTGSAKAFTNGTGWDSNEFKLSNYYCGGFTMKATTGVVTTVGGHRWLEVFCLDPNKIPAIPTSAKLIDPTLHFMPVVSTGGSGSSHKANAFPAFNGRCVVPFLGVSGRNLIQVSGGSGRAVAVSEVLNPFDPERADLRYW